MNKYTQIHTEKKAKKTKPTHNMREKVHPFHTQLLVFLFLASNAKHILQCTSDTLNTTLNTLWRCFEMCTPDKIKLNYLPPRRLTSVFRKAGKAISTFLQ